jgi:hypothetical protein
MAPQERGTASAGPRRAPISVEVSCSIVAMIYPAGRDRIT